MNWKRWLAPAFVGLLTACAPIPYQSPDYPSFAHKESGYDLNFYWNYEHPSNNETLVKGYVQNVWIEAVYNFKLEVASLDAGGKVIEKKYFYAFPQVLGSPQSGGAYDDAILFQIQLRRTGNEKAYRFCYQYESPTYGSDDNRTSRIFGRPGIEPAGMRSWCFTDKTPQ